MVEQNVNPQVQQSVPVMKKRQAKKPRLQCPQTAPNQNQVAQKAA